MKRKHYDELVKKARNCSKMYNLYFISDLDNEQEEEFNELKQYFNGLKKEIDDILTVDIDKFCSSFLEYLNKNTSEEYELETIKIEDEKLHFVRPRNVVVTTSDDLIDNEKVFVVGKNDAKVLTRPMIKIKNTVLPTISIYNVDFSYIYEYPSIKEYQKYLGFEDFMREWEDKTVEQSKKNIVKR